MFRNFEKSFTDLGDVVINFRKGGNGRPLLLLHGYPQTHVMWHKVAEELSGRFTVIVSDLRGYGDSGKPPSDEKHRPYSKRVSGQDQISLMKQLGYDRFSLVGHDRGARVGHRMALDHPEVIEKLVLMDIAPTYTMYTTTDLEFAKAYYHWFFLIQPYDFPEKMIGHDPRFYLEKKFKQWGRDSNAFTKDALSEYLRCFTPEAIHASCEDYRASASIDMEHDLYDIEQKRRIQCPLLCLWGDRGFVGNKYDIIAEWQKWADDVRGYSLPCGHYLPEEAPNETLEALFDFL